MTDQQRYEVDCNIFSDGRRKSLQLTNATAGEVTEYLRALNYADLIKMHRVFELHPDADYNQVWNGDEWLEEYQDADE